LAAIIMTEWQHGKNGEKPLCFHGFTDVSLTFFPIKLLFSRPTCNL